jgi:hypothetical protein
MTIAKIDMMNALNCANLRRACANLGRTCANLCNATLLSNFRTIKMEKSWRPIRGKNLLSHPP